MRLRPVIEQFEAQLGHRRTVLVGDLNMDPFESGVVAADGLHAVMSRHVAGGRYREVGGEIRHFFYNPMWGHFGDRPPSPPGTFFRAADGQTSYFWHMFDQMLIRPDLLSYFNDADLTVVTRIGDQSLLAASHRPDAQTFSDHLPIVFQLTLEGLS